MAAPKINSIDPVAIHQWNDTDKTFKAVKDLATETKQDDIITAVNSNYFIEVARGNVTGQTITSLFGSNPDMTASIDETIWDYGGIYTYLSADTTLYASSSNASDTAVIVSVTGLDDTYTEVTRTVTLNGQNQVALSGDMFRVFSAFVTGTTEPLGDIYIAESDTLTAGVPDTASKVKTQVLVGRNESRNALYTVPASKTAYIIGANFLAPKNVDVCFDIKVRLFGGLFRIKSNFDLYQNSVVPDVLGIFFPEKTDIEVTGKASSDGSSSSVRFTLLLIDN